MPFINPAATEILNSWSQGQLPTVEQIQQLLGEELANSERAKAFEVTLTNGQKQIEARSQLFCSVCSDVLSLCQNQGFKQKEAILANLWTLWLPLAIQLVEARQKLGRTLIQGILGGQGTGKTTLSIVIRLILAHFGYSTVDFSIDDLYLTYAERKKLQEEDPRLIWRGPPGTHDVDLGLKVLNQCLQADYPESILIPRFDKSLFSGAGDRGEPEKIDKADIVLFEGWFVGTRPIDDSLFDNPLPPITTAEDIAFAKDNNERLKAYLPLWNKLDRLIVLAPVDYHLSKQWRKEAEQKMIATGKSGMSDEEIEQFVEYFWRALHPELFIKPLVTNPDLADMVIEINADHSCGRVYQPGT
jgi:D-glycerate 3-kinase